MAEPRPLVVFESATLQRPDGRTAFRDLTWSINEGETWAVTGPIGSGKTALAEAVLGRHRLVAGSAYRPAGAIRLVAFKEESRLFSYGRHYYQQRFNFIEPHDDITLEEFLRAGSAATDAELRAAAGRLGVGELLPLSLIKLSNGQMRRARIARALLARPELLVLDEPLMGLDAAGRGEVADLLGGLVEHGTRVLLITRPEAIPGWVTHVLELEEMAVLWQGDRASWANRRLTSPGIFHQSPKTLENPAADAAGSPVIELRHVTVTYGGQAVLDDVSWTVRAGERWAVVGPNGAGKTTLLSLLCGDHPQAYANDVRLFGRRRGSGESIWDIKWRVGLVSPELHLYFTEPLTAAQAAATGFFDVLAPRRTTPEQDAAVRRLFEEFGIAGLSGRPFARLSTGEQRLVLLVRALVKAPPLLILDEPFQGLDRDAVTRAREWLDTRLRADQTLLFVSHHPDEIPRSVNHHLKLDRGRVAGP
jgi:molybdate transport system ATP-binding protein